MPKMKTLRAIRPLKYMTRMMVPGEVFEADKRYVPALLATKKAELVREPAAVPPPPPAVAAKIAAAVAPVAAPAPAAPQVDDDLLKARAEYREAFGRMAFHGWDAATLREKIAAAKSSTDN